MKAISGKTDVQTLGIKGIGIDSCYRKPSYFCDAGKRPENQRSGSWQPESQNRIAESDDEIGRNQR